MRCPEEGASRLGCYGASCHAPDNRGDFMFTYAFGERPEIRGRCADPVGPDRLPNCNLGPTNAP